MTVTLERSELYGRIVAARWLGKLAARRQEHCLWLASEEHQDRLVRALVGQELERDTVAQWAAAERADIDARHESGKRLFSVDANLEYFIAVIEDLLGFPSERGTACMAKAEAEAKAFMNQLKADNAGGARQSAGSSPEVTGANPVPRSIPIVERAGG